MDIGKPINPSGLDWDDSELIKAYKRGMQLTKKGINENKDNKETSNKKKKNMKEWLLGDYCRAPYPEDGLMYEARIIELYDDYCTVEYLGYDGEEEVELSQLEESAGKSARKKQKKKAENGYVSSDTERSEVSEVRELKDKLEYLKNLINRSGIQAPPPQEAAMEDSQDFLRPPCYSRSFYTQANNYLPNPTTDMPTLQIPLQHPSQVSMPPAPPMPQCPTITRDPSLSSLLVSWYMAGYYTGLHENQRTSASHCHLAPKHCCNRESSTCRH